MTDRILVPLDGSALAEAPLVRLARLLGGKDVDLVLVRAVEPLVLAEGDPGAVMTLLHEDAERYMKDTVSKLALRGLKAKGQVRVGGAAAGVLDAARETGSSMIAMTTHGRSGLARWLLGSVAQKVVRGSEVPVLLLRSFGTGVDGVAKPAPVAEDRFERIVVPVDGSRSSLEILPHVISLARRYQSRVLIVSVDEPGFRGGGFSGRLVDRPASAPALPKDPTPEDIATFTALSLAAEGLPTTSFRLDGDPATRILDFAREQKADLIAMATHGRSGPSRWLLGSVTEKVLQGAATPMLVVRSR